MSAMIVERCGRGNCQSSFENGAKPDDRSFPLTEMQTNGSRRGNMNPQGNTVVACGPNGSAATGTTPAAEGQPPQHS